MADRERVSLEWIRRNRQPRNRTESVGALAGRLLEKQGAGRQYAALIGLIGTVADDEFRRHCSLGPVQSGALTVLVDEPGLVRPMRDRWLVMLLDCLRSRRRELGVTRLHFKAGRSDIRLESGRADTETNAS